jgi:hypothetical protein
MGIEFKQVRHYIRKRQTMLGQFDPYKNGPTSGESNSPSEIQGYCNHLKQE